MGTSVGCNLIAQGVWPSLFRVAPKIEIAKAAAVREEQIQRNLQTIASLGSRAALVDYVTNSYEAEGTLKALGLCIMPTVQIAPKGTVTVVRSKPDEDEIDFPHTPINWLRMHKYRLKDGQVVKVVKE